MLRSSEGLATSTDIVPRSLVTTLRAAEKFDKSHLSSPAVAPHIDNAKVFYVEGYFLTHGTESVLEVSKKASETGKARCLLLCYIYIQLLLTCYVDRSLY